MIETTDNITNTSMPQIPDLPTPLRPLGRLAWNYWWSWSADGPSIFRDLDPEIWEECEHNPRLLLARTTEYRLALMATDPVYIERVHNLNSDQSRATCGLFLRRIRRSQFFAALFGWPRDASRRSS